MYWILQQINTWISKLPSFIANSIELFKFQKFNPIANFSKKSTFLV